MRLSNKRWLSGLAFSAVYYGAMEISILAVGKLKEAYLRQASSEYEKRLSRYARVSVTELPEEDVASRPAVGVLTMESERILGRIPLGHHAVALDRLGREFTSEEFAAYIEERMSSGTSRFAFIIGGALGLDSAVLERANLRLSLSKLTFPHQLVRIFLLEQLYRSFKIIRNEPYHY